MNPHIGQPSEAAFTDSNLRAIAPVQRSGALAVSTIFKLIIEDDEGKTTVYPLVEGEVSIGRKEGNTIRLMERNVSRRHARLIRESERIAVEDLDSYNGVRINGERIDGRHPVREGDLIEIGDYHLALRRADGEEAEETISLEDTQTLSPEEEPSAAPGGWPSGTLPDFRLPQDLLSSAQIPREMPTATDNGRAHEEPTQVPSLAPESPTSLPPFPAAPTPATLNSNVPTRAAALVQEPGDFESTKQLTRGPAAVDDVPRLVCVSTQHAGRVFHIDRPEMVIGREEGNNDIVVDHRSVSRNHAKIQFDGRSHKIIDLHSANGILVNGDDYTMTSLRAGDLIELGFVRFRFVPAGQRFEPDDEEAREMRKNGVEPPGARPELLDRARTLPAHDPSAAATVTDAPLPISSAPAPSLVEPASNGRDTEIDGSASWRSSLVGDPFERAPTAAYSPAEVSSPTALVTAAPVRNEREAPRKSGLDYRKTMIGLIVLLTGLVGVLLVLVGLRGDPRHDRRLEELFNQREYAAAKAYYDSHEGEFENERRALSTAIRAEVKMEQVEAPEPESDPVMESLPPEETLESSQSSEPIEGPSSLERSARAHPRMAKLAAAGEAAILSNNMRRASRVLQECIDRKPDFAICHRHMAVVQANRKNPRLAVRHYRRYLQLAPDAPDAPKVQEILQAFEQELVR